MARQELVRLTRACVAVAAMAVLLVPASADASSYAKRTLTVGSQGSDVKLFQKYLVKAGFPTRASGYYGSATRRAEKKFEGELGRTVDGKASPGDQKLAAAVARNGGDPNAMGQGSGGQGYDAASGNPTEKATLSSDGRTAIAPDSAPPEIKNVIAAANAITTKPYRYGGGHGTWEDSGYDCSGAVSYAFHGGGHGTWEDSGYDCSGAVSYALHGGGLLSKPLDSSGFMHWGSVGKGQWI